MNASVADRPRQSQWCAISLAEAKEIVQRVLSENLCDIQRIKIVDSKDIRLGDVLTADLRARRPHPSFRASIKDGYAVLASDNDGRRSVIGTSCARKDFEQLIINTGQCCRINTGAALPRGADAVIQVEDTTLVERNTNNEEAVIEIHKTPTVGQDIREIGTDVAVDELLLEAGVNIGAAELALLALNNQPHATIFEPARVSILSTGDEIIDAFLPDSNNYSIVDTNRPMLKALFQSKNFQTIDLGIVEDSPEKLKNAIEEGLRLSDVLVTSGGVSMGEKDYLKSVLTNCLGFTVYFGRVLMKPGLPTTFASGQIDGRSKLVFGLPGNPVSTFVTAQLFVVPALRRISGVKQYDYSRMIVECEDHITLDTRPEFRRACFKFDETSGGICIERGPGGAPLVQCVAGSQISSRLLSARSANLLLELPPRTNTRQQINASWPITAIIIGSSF